MISVWQVKRVYDKLTDRSTRWRVVNEEYGTVKLGAGRLIVTARDGTTLRATIWGKQVEVWVADPSGHIKVWVIVDEDLAPVTDIHCGLGSATDFVEVLGYAQHTVVWDDDEGYLADMPAVGGRELVVQFGEEAEEADAVCD